MSCGLCCNGVIFADVELQPGDSVEKLPALGFELKTSSRARGLAGVVNKRFKFCQPCRAWKDGNCEIYDLRPGHCRKFECLLLQEVGGGTRTERSARMVIRKALDCAETVRACLRFLGDTGETQPLSHRIARTRKRIELVGADSLTADTYSRLTLAVQDLHTVLSGSFYPSE